MIVCDVCREKLGVENIVYIQFCNFSNADKKGFYCCKECANSILDFAIKKSSRNENNKKIKE